MSSLQLPKDLEVLRFCRQPRTKYEVGKYLSNGQTTTKAYMERLERMGLLVVTREEKFRTGKIKKLYLTTAKGRAILRGCEEGERRK